MFKFARNQSVDEDTANLILESFRRKPGREGGEFLPRICASAAPIEDPGDVEFVINKDVVVMEIRVRERPFD
jgi:hypothetical protein